jgi:ribose 5-phosphate isomerase B
MNKEFTIVMASDHAGFELKEYLKSKLLKNNYKVEDVGCFSKEHVDYPDYILKGAQVVGKNNNKYGVFICGTGIGASIVANKVKNIRAALVYNKKTTILSRKHNNANVVVFGGRTISKCKAYKLLKLWLNTPFSNEERHQRRVKKISEIEKKIK